MIIEIEQLELVDCNANTKEFSMVLFTCGDFDAAK